MKELMPILKQSVDGSEVNTVNARELHEFLEVGKDFSTWIKKRIEEYDFQENQDFIKMSNDLASPKRGSLKSLNKFTTRIDYFLTLDMAKELSMVERNEKGSQARKYFIECERRLNGPSPTDLATDAIEGILFNPDFIIGLATNYKEALTQVAALTAEKEVMLPKAQVHDALMESDTALSIGDVAKILNKDFGIGRNRLYKFLRDQGVLMAGNLPKQTYMNRGYFRVIEVPYLADGEVKINKQTLVYQKGVAFIIRLLKQEAVC